MHTIIDDLRSDEDKVKFMGPNKGEEKWWKRASLWIKFARIGLPITYLVIALVILMPGIFNSITKS